MDSQRLLYIIIILIVFLLGLFLTIRRKPRQPTKLNLKAGEDFKPQYQTKKPLENKVNGLTETVKEATSAAGSEPSQKEAWLEPEKVVAAPPEKAKNLSIFFMYNGHDWEAHDVLGVPQGASLTLATEAYQKLLKTEDPSTFEFYEGAYNAILQRRKKERL